MANEEHHRGEDNDEQFQAVFGEHTGISDCLRDIIYEIRRNDPHTTRLFSKDFSSSALSDVALEVFGRYIANSTHMFIIDLERNGMTDDITTSLFRGLTKSSSIAILDLMRNNIGINTMRSMVPFLKNSPNLSKLSMSCNNIGSEGFQIAMQSLNGNAAMKELYFTNCNIGDISSLETYPLSSLSELCLGNNNIGRGGFIPIANLLQKEGSTLTWLDLQSTGMGDEEVEIIANSLKHNTMLQRLVLADNDIGQRGYVAFLRLLNDVSSIESTHNSNHTLTTLHLGSDNSRLENLSTMIPISIACKQNQESSSPKAAGRAKVIRTQLNSKNRKMLCQLQRMNENEPSNILAGIEPVALLPKILALIGMHHDESSLYTALVPLAPDLLSFIDRKALLKDTMTKNAADITVLAAEHARQVAALNAKFTQQCTLLTAKRNEFERRLACMEAEDGSQSKIVAEPKRQKMC